MIYNVVSDAVGRPGPNPAEQMLITCDVAGHAAKGLVIGMVYEPLVEQYVPPSSPVDQGIGYSPPLQKSGAEFAAFVAMRTNAVTVDQLDIEQVDEVGTAPYVDEHLLAAHLIANHCVG